MLSAKKIKYNQIKQVAMKIAEAVHPEKIILFGSYAYGKPGADSDLDFLVVVKDRTRKKRQEAFIKASSALGSRLFSVDIVVRSADDIPWRIREGDFFLQDIMEKGRVLYDQSNR